MRKPGLDRNAQRLDRQFDTLQTRIPTPFAKMLNWLRRPSARLVRIPLGLLMCVGGIFSFLPILGIWMLPLGLLLLAVDIPVLRGPVTGAIVRVRRKWAIWRRSRNK